MVATRTVAAPVTKVFAMLSDPARHKDTEPGDWVRDAIDPEPITRTGQIFAINMYLDRAGGHYVMHNLVTEFTPDRVIAWAPGQPDESGELAPGGWTWRYDLAPRGDQTDVTLTYDWSGTPQSFRDQVGGMPPFADDFLDESLNTLARNV
jgi:uncharacterized protein YndB with AHSA1/START domain